MQLRRQQQRQILWLIEVKANEAAESAVLASKKATEASTSAGEAKISQTKAKESEDKAYEYAQNAQSSVASVKWKGTSAEMDLTTDSPKWVKISRARMPQSTSTVYIEIIGGAGYEVNSPYQAAMADIVLRTASGDPRGLNVVTYRTMDSAVQNVATVNTDEDNYDIYLNAGAGAQKLIVNLQFSGAAVETLEVLRFWIRYRKTPLWELFIIVCFPMQMALLPDRSWVTQVQRLYCRPLAASVAYCSMAAKISCFRGECSGQPEYFR